MPDTICLVGLDEPESTALSRRLNMPVIAHESLPRIIVREGRLFVESPSIALRFLPVSKLVFHGIFEYDIDFMAGVALWGGPCFPNPQAVLDCRLKFPCLVRALRYTRFGSARRGYAAPGVGFRTEGESVAKWGNWHCGENKARFTGEWQGEDAAVIEPFLKGESVRVVMIGDRYWQIRLTGPDWLKSVHGPGAAFMDADTELVDDTRRIRDGFGLALIANDYIIAHDGTKHLLEVNHIPSVTCFPELWDAYADHVVRWVAQPLH
jgi:hypothetical protein